MAVVFPTKILLGERAGIKNCTLRPWKKKLTFVDKKLRKYHIAYSHIVHKIPLSVAHENEK